MAPTLADIMCPMLGAHNVVHSRRWYLWVNRLAASSLLSRRARAWCYRRAGIRSSATWVEPGCYLHSDLLELGEGSRVNRDVYVENHALVSVGPGAILGFNVQLYTSTHDIGPPEARAGAWRAEPIVVGSGVWVGARTTILGGVTIGAGCVIAAGAVVIRDCEPNGLYAGVPARRVRDLR